MGSIEGRSFISNTSVRKEREMKYINASKRSNAERIKSHLEKNSKMDICINIGILD